MRGLVTGIAAALLALAALLAPGASARRAGEERPVAFKGVGFYYDAALASDVKAEVARPGGCGKPGDVLPTHAAFTLVGYPKPHESPFMTPPEIQIFPVAEYRRALAACEKEMADTITPPSPLPKVSDLLDYVADLDDQVSTLKALNAARPAPRALSAFLRRNRARGHRKGRMPLVPMYDVGEALRAKVSYLDFRNGRGVAFVTQYTIEDTLVSNQALAYVFQGLTNDGEYYVSAAFPVAAPFLPADYSDEEARRLGLNYTVMFTPRLRRRYTNYLAATARRLDALSPDRYRPRLGLFDDLIRSLSVNTRLLNSSMNLK